MFKKKIKEAIDSPFVSRYFLIKLILSPFSLIYLFGVKIRRYLYTKGFLKRVKAKCKVISVGGISWGGSGKTELTKRVADFFSKRNKRIGIILSDYAFDEYELLRRDLRGVNIYIGKKYKLARLYGEDNDILIVDDGFSHLKLHRDVDIVCIDSINASNKMLLPAGPLREPYSALKYADFILLTYAQFLDEESLQRLKPFESKIFFSSYKIESFLEPTEEVILKKEDLIQRKLGAFCSIGNAHGFFKILEEHFKLHFKLDFLDHYRFSEKDIKLLEEWFKKLDLDFFVITKKDFVKLRTFEPKFSILIAIPSIEIEDEERFFHLLSSKIHI